MKTQAWIFSLEYNRVLYPIQNQCRLYCKSELLFRSLRTKDTSVKYTGKAKRRQESFYAYVSLASMPSLCFHKYKFPFQICSRVKKHPRGFTVP